MCLGCTSCISSIISRFLFLPQYEDKEDMPRRDFFSVHCKAISEMSVFE